MKAEAHDIPRIGLGTFGLTGAEGLSAIESAINLGYRHLDTAQSYGTETNVGAAVAGSEIDRAEFFVTTKIAQANLGRIRDSVDDSLAVMGLDHADMVLIHWPAPDDDPPVREYIGDLARLQESGRARLIGVSNFTRRLIDEAIAEIGPDRLATNQVERHVFLQNHLLADHCRDRGIVITAYMPVVRGRLSDAPELEQVAKEHRATPSQIALAFLLALGSIVIPKSASPERQAQNLAALEVRLNPDGVARLRTLDRGERHIDPAMAPNWD